jgi:hypothetical protein
MCTVEVHIVRSPEEDEIIGPSPDGHLRGAWHGDPDLKALVGAKLKEHQAQDQFAFGEYQRWGTHGDNFVFKGCAIGCTLPKLKAQEWGQFLDEQGDFCWHVAVQEYYGIPIWVGAKIDYMFERASNLEDASNFAIDIFGAIPVGADLSLRHDCLFTNCPACRFNDFDGGDTFRIMEWVADAPIIGQDS